MGFASVARTLADMGPISSEKIAGLASRGTIDPSSGEVRLSMGCEKALVLGDTRLSVARHRVSVVTPDVVYPQGRLRR